MKTVVIIGSGLAGLRAAEILLGQKGLRVIVLEARKRIGGRAFTSTDHPAFGPIDRGCSWIHGRDKNPIFAIAQKTNAAFYELDGSAIREDNHWLSRQEASVALDSVFDLGPRAVAISQTHMEDIDLDTSFHEFCLRMIEQEESLLSESDKERAKKLVHFYTAISAEEVTKQSLRNYKVEEELTGGSPMLASTYSPIIQHVAEPLLKSNALRLNHKVKEISHRPEGITIHYRDQEIPEQIDQELTANAVICTVPLGVLKTSSIKFQPELPSRLSEAIATMGMGSAEKLFIKMVTPFWLLPTDGQTHVSSNNVHGSTDVFIFLPKNDSEPFIELISLAKFQVNTKPVLLCYSAGEVARSIAKKWNNGGRKAVEGFILPYIAQLPGYRHDDPDCQIEDIFSTDWLHDEYSLGSYSFSEVGSVDTVADRDALAQGVPESNLFFAGEHVAARGTNHEIGVCL